MLTRNRLIGLRDWIQDTICKGRLMKAPGKDADITKIIRKEPVTYIGYYPAAPDFAKILETMPSNTAPSILLLPGMGSVKNVEEKRFDRYNNIRRSQEYGQWLNVNFLFCVYEPGIRLPGFIDSTESRKGFDMSKLEDGSEEGLFTLLDWMDALKSNLLGRKTIPGTDLTADEMTMNYGPYNQSGYIVDKRPLYFGMIEASFQCFADEKPNEDIDKFLL